MSDNEIWYGYLEAGEKSGPVLLDPRLSTGKSDTIYLFNLLRGQILEYNRNIVEPKLRGLKPEEKKLMAELESAYAQARRSFAPRMARVADIPERGTRRQPPADDIEIEEAEELETDEAVVDDDEWDDEEEES